VKRPEHIDRISNFFERDLWRASPQKTSRFRNGVRRTARMIVLAVRGFWKDDAIHNASALSFDTVLALVPMLALFFATLKGLGAYEAFVDDSVRPWILRTFGEVEDGNVGLREAFLQILSFGENTELAPLGLVGLVFVLYLVLLLLNTVETVMNRIWGVERARSLTRKVADYAALLFMAPFGLFVVTAVARWEASIRWLGPTAHAALVEIVVVAAVSLVFSFLYLVMPHTRTRFRSALIGGLVTGPALYAIVVLYGATQVGVARYNALYSSFAAIPLFLVWVFVSWLVILFGAEVAAAHHNQTGFRWRVHHHDASPNAKRFLAVRLLVLITRTFIRGEAPFTLTTLAQRAGVPEALVKDVLEVFVEAELVSHAIHRGSAAYVPSKDISTLRVADVFAVLRNAPDDETFAPETTDDEGKRILWVIEELDRAETDASHNYTLKELAIEEVNDSVRIVEGELRRDDEPEPADRPAQVPGPSTPASTPASTPSSTNS
jgi:membrane protein